MTKTRKRGVKACVASVVALILMVSMMPNNFITKENKVEAYGEDETGKYFYAEATLYDYDYDSSSYYYYDYGTPPENPGAGNVHAVNGTRGGARWAPKLQVPYESINREISSYYSGYSNTSAVPLYFGNFYGTKYGYPSRPSGDDAWNDWHQHTHKDGVGQSTYDQTYNNFYLSANLSPANAATVIGGLVDKTLVGGTRGNISQNGGNKLLWQFNDNATSSYKHKYTTSKGFPFNVTTDSHGVKAYSFDSASDYARVYDNGEIIVKEDGKGRVENYSTDGVTAGNYGFFPFNSPNNTITQGSDRTNVNYGFGMRIDVPFTLASDGKVEGTDGSRHDVVFDFSGDDDIWVFVDDFLVLDMGGDHAKIDGHINFASGAVTISNSTTVNTTRRDYQATGGSAVSTTLAALYNSAKGGSGLPSDFYSPNKQHNLTIFYMERGMFESNLKMSFNFYNENKNELTVEEQTKFNRVNSALLAQTKKVADSHVFNYTLENMGTTGQASDSGIRFPTYSDINRVNNEATGNPTTKLASSTVQEYTQGGSTTTKYVYLNPGVWNSTGNPKYEAYFFNNENDKVWVSPTSNDGTYWKFEDPGNYAKVIFVRMNPSGAAHTWSSKWNQTDDITINDSSPVTTISGWRSDKSNSPSLNGTAAGCPRSVTVTTPSEPLTFGSRFAGTTDSYTAASNIAYILKDPFASDATGITGTGGTAGQFNLFYGESSLFKYQFVADSTMRVTQNASIYKITSGGNLGTTKTSNIIPGPYHNHTFGTASITLSHYYDTKVRAVDLNASSARLSEYSTDKTSGIPYVYKNTNASSTEPVRVKQTFENEIKVGHLIISKETEYEDETTDGFTFNVTLSNLFTNTSGNVDITGLTYDVYSSLIMPSSSNVNGYWTARKSRTGYVKDGVTINVNEFAVIRGIPVDTHYQVTESSNDNYEIKRFINSSGNITADSYTYNADGTINKNTSNNNIVSCTNKRKTGVIDVSKTITGTGADTSKEFDVTINLTYPTGTGYDDVDLRNYISQSNLPTGMTLSNAGKKTATITFKVTNGSIFELNNIPYGTAFTIEETTDSDYKATITKSMIDSSGAFDSVTINGNSGNGTISNEDYIEYTFAFENKHESLASVTIKKVDNKNNAIPGAEFKIYANVSDAIAKNNNTVVGATYNKNVAGTEFTFGNLRPNTKYYVAETVVPEDYQGLTEPLEVTTGAGGTNLSFNAVNVPEDIVMPETGALHTPINYMGTGIIVMSLAGIAMLIYKRKLRRSAVAVEDTRGKQ